MSEPILAVLGASPELVGALLRARDEDVSVVAYEDAAEALAAARKADIWLCVLDFREASSVAEGVVRRLRGLPSQPEILLLPPPGPRPRLDLPGESVLEPEAGVEQIVEQVRRLLDLQRVRRDSGIVGQSPRIRELLATVAQVAPLDVPVLVHGESGTGKEMVARALHARSRRQGAPFVSINVGSLAETLLESELFGHEKGSFTGAVARRAGVFERADGGTLFLDELGEMSPGMQVKLLRVLETSEFQRVGGTETLRTDVRVIAATHRDLEEEMAAGRFRSDLYYRLKVVKVDIPPLRERPDDILVLAQHFLEEADRRHDLHHRGFTTELMQRLRQYAWPGNVRELRNVVMSMAVMARGEFLGVEHLPEELRSPRAHGQALPVRSPDPWSQEGGSDPLWTSTLLALVADVRRLLDRTEQISERLERIERMATGGSAARSRGVDDRGWADTADEAEFVPLTPDQPTDMASAEKALIEATLRQFDGNRRKTAAQLGIGERTLYRKLKQYGIG